jgi:hypothetical protein
LQTKGLFDAAAAAQATATTALSELLALGFATKKAGSAPDPSGGPEEATTSAGKGGRGNGQTKRQTSPCSCVPRSPLANKGGGGGRAECGCSCVGVCNPRGGQSGHPRSPGRGRARAAASRAAAEAEAEAAAEKELADGASAERPEEELDDEDREREDAEEWVRTATAEFATVTQNANAPRPL